MASLNENFEAAPSHIKNSCETGASEVIVLPCMDLESPIIKDT